MPEGLYYRVMGRTFRVTRICMTQEEANGFMLANPGTGLLTVVNYKGEPDFEGDLLLIADMTDRGV